jgi:hypothetical protein
MEAPGRVERPNGEYEIRAFRSVFNGSGTASRQSGESRSNGNDLATLFANAASANAFARVDHGAGADIGRPAAKALLADTMSACCQVGNDLNDP